MQLSINRSPLKVHIYTVYLFLDYATIFQLLFGLSLISWLSARAIGNKSVHYNAEYPILLSRKQKIYVGNGRTDFCLICLLLFQIKENRYIKC